MCRTKIDTIAQVLDGLAHGRFTLRRCRVCARRSLFIGLASYDESWRCISCGANRRYELTAEALNRILPTLPTGARVVELDHRSPLRKPIGKFASRLEYIRCAYVPDQPFGQALRDKRYLGARNEDLTSLSFASGSVSLLIACDVLEHVEALDAALGEVFRVLLPGGSFVFSIPQVRVVAAPDGGIATELNQQASRQKARSLGGEIVFLNGCPEFHIDPLVPSGIPVFWSFGPDAMAFVQARTGLRIEKVAGPEGPDRRVVFRGLKSRP